MAKAMNSDLLKELRASEGKVVWLTSTEGEVLSARVLHVSDEDDDVTIDILSTNQPERYVQMGKNYMDTAWAMPFSFIAAIEPWDGNIRPR